jgi:CheY-like chemotaxis protein
MSQTPVNPVVVYGDLATVTETRDAVVATAAALGLWPVEWFSDPEGLRDTEDPSEADELVAALAECHRLRSGLFVPYVVDVPREQQRRVIGHWLHRHDLSFFVGLTTLAWHDPNDDFDRALRRQLDMASDLELAVAASVAVPALDRLVGELLGQRAGNPEDRHPLPGGDVPATATSPGPPTAECADRMSVVMVNDEPDIRMVVRMQCELDGRFRIVGEAATGREALQLVERGCPDCVLLDTFMPDLTGMEVLPEVRARCPGTRIIVFAPPYGDWFSVALTLGADAAIDCSTTRLTDLLDLMADLCGRA